MNKLILLGGKTISKALKISGRRATTLPGKVVSSLNGKFPSKFKIKGKVIFVTGTNGKTSCANLISQILRDQGYLVLNNSKGANLLSGITTVMLEHANYKMELNYDFFVFEIDESTMPNVAQQITPDYIVITNFFRDQLDRHFEISQVINKVQNSINSNAKLIINGDDALSVNLANKSGNETIYYSVDRSKYSTKVEPMVREARYCFHCKKKLYYEYINYGHFGMYKCNNCDFKHPISKYIVKNVDLDNKSFTLNDINFTMQAQELYTMYNFSMAISLGLELGLKVDILQKSIAQFKLNNSRMESFIISDKNVKMNIVKNQIGFDATVEAFLLDKTPKTFIYVLNNNYADSVDTSWIWDCNYGMLKNQNIKKFICSGMRRYELATRISLENPDFDIEIVDTKEMAYNNIKNYEGNVYVISAYTAHMATSDYLKSMELEDKND